MLQDMYPVFDELKRRFGQSRDAVVQEIFSNGWRHDYQVGNLFFLARSLVPIPCAVRATGSMHDTCIAK